MYRLAGGRKETRTKRRTDGRTGVKEKKRTALSHNWFVRTSPRVRTSVGPDRSRQDHGLSRQDVTGKHASESSYRKIPESPDPV